ncbi:collagen-like protein [Lactobacillus salivarius]|uniref:collagen-like protein n=1 Tax=Ligilactobacillus salivarius TaxID=1624 RepID=UPI0015C67174|nr:collagen-like protein [Ligilactobacillus salivarius]NXZ96352.1 collagen-like protein [Ligilactobacillus salivarius]NYA61197.1 collagen-like protein [Ligilactobacillus salivarius]NYA63910.1 collagen-like protein [Ligilactobacillus salivarius]NYA65903.1 collagen-like protein [Ligilactobacillus salivarius]NYA67671.1 collagen-like protein [Ligilactobacillus salivarius]
MKTLTINQKVFKHQDTQTKLKIALFEDDSKVSLDSNSEYQFKIKNSSGYLKSEKLTIEDNRLVLTTDKLKGLPPDTYNFEVWQNEDSIYPSENYGYFSITKNTTEVDGKTIPVITIEEFNKRIDEALKKVESIEQIKGEKGDRGEKGDKGDTGERGADGTDGRDGIDGKNGQDGKSAYQIWLDLGNSGSEQDFINSLKLKVERHAPTGYMLDTSTKPWTLLFDNGCIVYNSLYWNNGAIFRPDPSNQRVKGDFPVYSIPDTIMNVLKGLILYSEFKNSNWDGGFFSGTTVENPINNGDKYNWDGTKIKKDGTSAKNRAIFARTIYELGIWSDEIVEELGAVRK